MSSSGDATTASDSASQLLSTLAPVALYAGIYFVLFLVFKRIFPRQYNPRTFMSSLPKNARTPEQKPGILGWFRSFFSLSDTYVLNHHSLDGFLLLRLLKMAVVTCLVGCAITWPILFPVNATGGGNAGQLDILNMSNITNNFYRYFAHVGCAYLVFGFILFMITRESIYYIHLRQAYLLSPRYASRLSSRTVLFTSVPAPYTDVERLRDMLGLDPDRRIWVATNTKDLDQLVKDRDDAAYRLEAAETKLIRAANKKRLAREKKSGPPPQIADASSSNNKELESGSSSAARYMTPEKKDRPTHRLKPLIGKKVDSIDWCRAELSKLIPQVRKEQNKHKRLDPAIKKLNSVFVEFATIAEAQAAYQSLTHHQPLHMAPRFTGMTPGEIIWSNLRIRWWERVMRVIVTTSFITALVIFWCIPVAFVGSISNVDKIAGMKGFHWLSWFHKIPTVIQGVVTGLLPTVLLAVLMALLPIFLRLMAKWSGDPTLSAVELSVQNYYFAFQIVNVFLATTLGSSASSAAGSIISHPSGITTLLANSIPKASNFYLSYFVLQGLAIVSSLLLQLSALVVFIVLGKLLDGTPRKKFNRWYNLSATGWGTLWPIYTNLFVIAICYAIIAPLVMGFAAVGLYFFYLAHRYDLLYVSNQSIDTKGRLYPRALQQLFIGLYVAQVCLIGLFAIGTGTSVGALGPLILMIAFLIFTALYHLSLNAALAPLIDYLPKSLEAEERSLLEADKTAENSRAVTDAEADLNIYPHKKPNMITKFFKPHIYNDYATMRRLVTQLKLEDDSDDFRFTHDEIASHEAIAYYNPSITSDAPLLWIPHDTMGISKQEIEDNEPVIPTTDDDAGLDDKNNIVWGHVLPRPPIFSKSYDY